jgi:cell division transport system ATP-binding protein
MSQRVTASRSGTTTPHANMRVTTPPNAGQTRRRPVGRTKKASPQNAVPAVRLSHVDVAYPDAAGLTLEDVSLTVMPGEFVIVVGMSGAGKSTFLRLLNRTLVAKSGTVEIGGQDVSKLNADTVPMLRRQVGTVFQDYKLLPYRTAYENVAFAMKCVGASKADIERRAPEALKLVGLANKMDSYPKQMSGGEQQRVSIARAMVNNPPLLVCDEPTGNLDPAISFGIMQILERINANGTTVIMSTHDNQIVDSTHHRIIEFRHGHVVRDERDGNFYDGTTIINGEEA